MDQEVLVSMAFLALVGAGVWLHQRFSSQGRLRRLAWRHGKANALNLIGAAYIERTSAPGYYEAILWQVGQLRMDAASLWERMTPEERDELGRLAADLLGPGGAKAWLDRKGEAARRSVERIERERRTSFTA